MSNDAVKITNLLHRYAELIDSGQFEICAKLFDKARIKTSESKTSLTSVDLLDLWRSTVTLYPCGTPRTKHIVTNAIVDIDEDAGTASARSYYTILQATENFPLQVIGAGRYHDQFASFDDEWHFTFRDYSLFDALGDVSHHLNMASVVAQNDASSLS